MPYGIKMRGSRHCVYNTATGAIVKCHPTHGAALAHQRALTVNVTHREPDVGQQLWESPAKQLTEDIEREL